MSENVAAATREMGATVAAVAFPRRMRLPFSPSTPAPAALPRPQCQRLLISLGVRSSSVNGTGCPFLDLATSVGELTAAMLIDTWAVDSPAEFGYLQDRSAANHTALSATPTLHRLEGQCGGRAVMNEARGDRRAGSVDVRTRSRSVVVAVERRDAEGARGCRGTQADLPRVLAECHDELGSWTRCLAQVQNSPIDTDKSAATTETDLNSGAVGLVGPETPGKPTEPLQLRRRLQIHFPRKGSFIGVYPIWSKRLSFHITDPSYRPRSEVYGVNTTL